MWEATISFKPSAPLTKSETEKKLSEVREVLKDLMGSYFSDGETEITVKNTAPEKLENKDALADFNLL